MPKGEKSFRSAILNIVLQPHSPELYVDLFRDAIKLKRSVKLRGSDWLALSSIQPLEGRLVDGFYGSFFKYINLDPKKPWLNIDSLEPLTGDGEENVVDIPDHLKPNLRMIPYVFYPRQHRLFFDSSHLSPISASKALNQLFDSPAIIKKYNSVQVHFQQQEETLRQILRIPALTRLNIVVNVPNPDDFTEAVKQLEERLKRQNAKKLREEYTGKKNEGLEPDKQTKALMHLALSNGHVSAVGYSDGKRVTKKTIEHPHEETITYNPKQMTPIHALAEYGMRVLLELK